MTKDTVGSLQKDHKSKQSEFIKASKEAGKLEQKAQEARMKAEGLRLEAEEIHDKMVIERTAGFKPQLISRARNLGINPDNFETPKELLDAVKQLETEQEEESDSATSDTSDDIESESDAGEDK